MLELQYGTMWKVQSGIMCLIPTVGTTKYDTKSRDYQGTTLNIATLGTTLMGPDTRWKGDVTVGVGGPPANYSV